MGKSPNFDPSTSTMLGTPQPGFGGWSGSPPGYTPPMGTTGTGSPIPASGPDWNPNTPSILGGTDPFAYMGGRPGAPPPPSNAPALSRVPGPYYNLPQSPLEQWVSQQQAGGASYLTPDFLNNFARQQTGSADWNTLLNSSYSMPQYQNAYMQTLSQMDPNAPQAPIEGPLGANPTFQQESDYIGRILALHPEDPNYYPSYRGAWDVMYSPEAQARGLAEKQANQARLAQQASGVPAPPPPLSPQAQAYKDVTLGGNYFGGQIPPGTGTNLPQNPWDTLANLGFGSPTSILWPGQQNAYQPGYGTAPQAPSSPWQQTFGMSPWGGLGG